MFRRSLATTPSSRSLPGDSDSEHLGLGFDLSHSIASSCRSVSSTTPGLIKLSKDGQLSLVAGRDEDDSRLIFAISGAIRPTSNWNRSPRPGRNIARTRRSRASSNCDGKRYDNLLKETIFGATQEIRKRLGADDWCVSVFEDNAGVVKFDDHYHVCFKVETHNHPSAIEPYGGANTGLGGVIRDPLGTGWAPSRSATPMSSASLRPIRRRNRCRRASCIRRR